jgi:secreted trypsin-like serine protease
VIFLPFPYQKRPISDDFSVIFRRFSRSYGQNAQFCGSSLIDSTTVLTAAHCFMDQNGNQGTFASWVL